MSFITQFVKKLAEKSEPESWSIDKYTKSGKGDDQGERAEVTVTYRLDADEIAMLHVIDEDGDLPLGAGQ